MLHQHKATQVTSADPGDAGDLLEIAGLYRYPDALEKPFVRANMIASIDGATAVKGTSGGLGGSGDRAIFRVLRGLADVVVVGARTAIAEGYHQPGPDAVFADARRRAGRSAAPMLALISNSLSIDTDYSPLADPATVVFTCTNAPAAARRALTEHGATLLDCGTGQVRFDSVLAHLARLGRTRVLCEGGPSLLRTVVAEGLLDELCLTTSPTLAAGDATRILAGPALSELARMRAAHILSDDEGFVFTRWARDR
ncbi:dihydrofolate reductase family protein [Gordonia sp. DT30]|uniref:dihydrofolate reductase family protein n=1 Tax=unclassified Gordonia (in: high G+C Gram-positive bacteria) TaxID=2657482 RepID=UPI003CF7759D